MVQAGPVLKRLFRDMSGDHSRDRAGSDRKGLIELHPFQFEFLGEFEGDIGFGGQNNLFVSSERGATRTRACTSGRADGGSFASAGERSDDSAESGAAA